MSDYCQASGCRDQISKLTAANSMRVHPIDRSKDYGSSFTAPKPVDQILTIHRTCFDPIKHALAD